MNIVTALKQALSGSKPTYTIIEYGQRKEAIEKSLKKVADGTFYLIKGMLTQDTLVFVVLGTGVDSQKLNMIPI